MISQDDMRQIDQSFGTSMTDSSASGEDAPNGNNMAGALNHLVGISEELEKYGMSYSDAPPEKQEEIDEIVEDLRYHIEKLSNHFADMVGNDSEIELPNGNSVPLPGQATSGGGTNKELPADPRNQGGN